MVKEKNIYGKRVFLRSKYGCDEKKQLRDLFYSFHHLSNHSSCDSTP